MLRLLLLILLLLPLLRSKIGPGPIVALVFPTSLQLCFKLYGTEFAAVFFKQIWYKVWLLPHWSYACAAGGAAASH